VLCSARSGKKGGEVKVPHGHLGIDG